MLKLHDYISMDSFGLITTVKQKLKQGMAFASKLQSRKKEEKKKKKKPVEGTLLKLLLSTYMSMIDDARDRSQG